MVKIAVLSYNSIYNYTVGVIKRLGYNILALPRTFNPKCPESVLPSDTNWQTLMKHKDSLEWFVIFAGKKSSGSLEIIRLACESFADKKGVLFFVLCDHDLQEKEDVLKSYDIKRTQYVCFEDGHLPCQESAILMGYAYDYIERINTKN